MRRQQAATLLRLLGDCPKDSERISLSSRAVDTPCLLRSAALATVEAASRVLCLLLVNRQLHGSHLRRKQRGKSRACLCELRSRRPCERGLGLGRERRT